MTDISNLVLRWEVENATAKLATGRMESGMFEKGGFRWIAAVERTGQVPGYPNQNWSEFSLRCDVDHDRSWNCKATVDLRVFRKDGSYNSVLTNGDLLLSNSNCSWVHQGTLWWKSLGNETLLSNDKAVYEFRINIISADHGELIVDPTMFAAPNDMSNIILKIEDKKLHVSKELLSIHSPVFKTLFFGEFVEKGKEEVEIKEVVYEEFIDLLHLIYMGAVDISGLVLRRCRLSSSCLSDRTVKHILKLADQFQMERVLNFAKKHLTQSKGFDTMAKLVLADKYRLAELRDCCLKSFTNATELSKKLKSSPEYENLSDAMKAAICDRIVKLTT